MPLLLCVITLNKQELDLIITSQQIFVKRTRVKIPVFQDMTYTLKMKIRSPYENFLSAFRKIAKSDYFRRHIRSSFRLSVWLHGTTRLPLD